MLTLYSLLFLMLVAALLLLATPFYKSSSLKKRRYVIFFIFLLVCPLVIYYFSSDEQGLMYWLTEGRAHYQLQEKVAKLGGTKGIITQIKKKLETNPRDAQGWFILGKLYVTEQDYASALAALKNAQELDPGNKEISDYYNMARQHSSLK